MIQLIPGADASASDESLFVLERMKATWRPTPANLQARSFPTPFAQAEMMTHVLGLLQLIPGARQAQPELENPRLEQTFERWRLLVLGIVLGALEIDAIDLRHPSARRFGAMLGVLRPDAPYLALLRATDATGLEGRKLVVGAADPRCLAWCSPRLGSFIDHAATYWNGLKRRVESSADLGAALTLLADWRASLKANGLWSSGDEAAPWMRGLDVMLGATRDSGGERLARDARFVGPLPLAFTARGGGFETRPVYLPAHAPGWAARFGELLFDQPVPRAGDPSIVDLIDPVGRAVAEIRVAAPTTGATGLELFAGVGALRVRDDVPRVHGNTYWLDDHPRARGYRSLVLEPVLAAAASTHRRVRIEERNVLENPVLFPDTVRLIAQHPQQDEPDSVRIVLSRALTAKLRTGIRAPDRALALAAWNVADAVPDAIGLPPLQGAVSVGLVERIVTDATVVDVGEMRGLGFALWLAFIGEARLRPDGARIVWSAAEEQELIGRSVVGDVESPLEVYRDALSAVNDAAVRAGVAARLATLQRFARAWRAGDEHDLGERVGRLGVEAFLAWVLEPGARVANAGPARAPVDGFYVTGDAVRIPLRVDPMLATDAVTRPVESVPDHAPIRCDACGFDLAVLPMTVLYAGRGVDGVRRRFCCPVCRNAPLEFGADRMAFPIDDAHWIRWRETGLAHPADVLTFGRLRLRIDARVDVLSAREICFRAVPVFNSAGVDVAPALPVHPERLDALEPSQLEIAQRDPTRFARLVYEAGRLRYRATIPLRGLRETEWPTIECEPFVPPSRATPIPSFRGVTLRVWPNLRRALPEWRYHVVSLIASETDGAAFFAPEHRVEVAAHVPRGDRGHTVVSLAAPAWSGDVTGAPRTLVGACEHGRPAWISMNVVRGDGERVAGGLFAVPPNGAVAQRAGELSLGLDFGTTNTVVAVRSSDGATRCLSPERDGAAPTSLAILDGGALRPEARESDLWPGGTWAGPYRDLVPTELLSPRRWTDLTVSDIDALRLGVDVGIPLAGVRPALAADHLVSEFKWLRAVQRERAALAQPETVEALQARYLESVMMMSLAALLADDVAPPRDVTVYYAYPLAFEDHDLRSLERAAGLAEKRLAERTGIRFRFMEATDEANAATGTTGTGKMFRVCVDLGGGSLEVLVDDGWARAQKLGHEGMHPHVFSTSVFFGGSVYLRSLMGTEGEERRTACVLPGVSYPRLASEVRRWDSARTLTDAPGLLADARRVTAIRRARVYVGYVVELVARVLAGVCLEHGRTASGGIDVSHNRLFTRVDDGQRARWILGTPAEGATRVIDFALVLLGNGWGFGDIVREGASSVDEMVAQRVRIRLLELLEGAAATAHIRDADVALSDLFDHTTAGGRLRLEVRAEAPAGGHRKTRVARGLLEAQQVGRAQNLFETRAVGAHGVLGFDLLLVDAARDVPYYRPYGRPPASRPELMPKASPDATLARAAVAAPVAPIASAPLPRAAPPAAPTSAIAPPFASLGLGTLESAVWLLSQQWPQVTAAAAAAGLVPLDYASRQLWAQVASAARAQGKSAEALLASERWAQLLTSTLPEPGAIDPADGARVQWQQIVARANAAGQSTESLLAAERWEQLLAALAQRIPLAGSADEPPPPPPFPFKPRS